RKTAERLRARSQSTTKAVIPASRAAARVLSRSVAGAAMKPPICKDVCRDCVGLMAAPRTTQALLLYGSSNRRAQALRAPACSQLRTTRRTPARRRPPRERWLIAPRLTLERVTAPHAAFHASVAKPTHPGSDWA